MSQQPLSQVSDEASSDECAGGKAQAVVEQYFETFNQGAFEQTADLFAPTGKLSPPFESAIVGPVDIARYLHKSGQQMVACPQSFDWQPLPGGHLQVAVKGRVQAIAFGVNVAWQFEVNAEGRLTQATIRLMASPNELLSLKRLR
jgi:hypothetical protein